MVNSSISSRQLVEARDDLKYSRLRRFWTRERDQQLNLHLRESAAGDLCCKYIYSLREEEEGPLLDRLLPCWGGRRGG